MSGRKRHPNVMILDRGVLSTAILDLISIVGIHQFLPEDTAKSTLKVDQMQQ